MGLKDYEFSGGHLGRAMYFWPKMVWRAGEIPANIRLCLPTKTPPGHASLAAVGLPGGRGVLSDYDDSSNG